jgi:hypothetical protein
MVKKLEYFQIPIAFYSGVPQDDPRIRFVSNTAIRRTASICYGHLDMLQHFIDNSNKPFAIIMEDDILIKETFVTDIEKAVDVCNSENLDLLLIGYLCSNPIHTYSNFPEICTKYSTDEFRILGYPDSTWGAQMYMISKDQAKRIIEKYSYGYLEQSLENPDMTPFSSDWTITKEGSRAVLYPLRVIENGSTKYEDEGQDICRVLCAKFTGKEGFI